MNPIFLLLNSSHRVLKKSYKKGEAIYRAGEKPSGIYLLLSGLVGLVGVSQKGGEHLLRLFHRGQFFGHRALFAKQDYHANSICLERSEVAFMAAEDVWDNMSKDPTLSFAFLERLAQEVGHAEMLRIQLTEQDVFNRTAAAVVYLKDIEPNHLWTRDEIAKFVASTGPSVIRALAQLEQEGLIEQKGREIIVLNRDALIEISSQ